MKHRPGRAAVVAVVTAAAVLLPATAAHAADVPLTGEFLAGTDDSVFSPQDYPTDGSNPEGCNPDGESVIEFTQEGVATGPYPGTYTEHVVITIGPQAPAGPELSPGQPGILVGPVTSFQSEFTIDSPVGLVTGTKSLDPDGTFATNTGSCFGLSAADGGELAYPYLSDFSFSSRSVDVALTYSATIEPVTGDAFRDSGTAWARWEEGRFKGTCTGGTDPGTIAYCQSLEDLFGDRTVDNSYFTQTGFEERFLTSNGTEPVPPPLPTTADQCKNGGYKAFPIFRNQGDCVSFVRTGGANPPAGQS